MLETKSRLSTLGGFTWLQRTIDFWVKCGCQKILKRQNAVEWGMTFEVSIQEELERVNKEISALERCKRVLEDTLASEMLKR